MQSGQRRVSFHLESLRPGRPGGILSTRGPTVAATDSLSAVMNPGGTPSASSHLFQ